MGIFDEAKINDGYSGFYDGRLPVIVRLLRRFPWLARLQWWHVIVLTLAALALAFVAVHSTAKPHAETLAIVDGAAITSADLAAEAQANGVALNAVDAAGRKALLARVVDRRVMVAAARKAGLIEDPTFQAVRARADEMMLAGAIAQRFAGPPPVIDDAAARQFMAAHPAMFADRQTLVIDGIAADISQIPAALLEKVDTMDDAVALLGSLQLPNKRAKQRLDSATLPPAIAKTLATLPQGKVVAFNRGAASIIATILERIPNPLSADEQLNAARNAAARQQADGRIERALSAMRAKTTISYPAGKPL